MDKATFFIISPFALPVFGTPTRSDLDSAQPRNVFVRGYLVVIFFFYGASGRSKRRQLLTF
jgi:hypothetical protein